MKPTRRTLIGVAAILAIVAAACGGDDGGVETTAPASTISGAVTSTSAAPATTNAAAPAGVTFVGADGVETVITDTGRIVSLSGDLTEIVFALGLGDNVVAIDVTTTYPADALQAPAIGFAQQLAAEPVLAFEPTVVLADQLTGPPEAITQLREAGIPVVVFETQTTLDGVATKIRQVAEVLGVPDAGAALAASVQAEIDAATARAATATSTPRVAFVYVRGPETLLIFGQGMPTQSMIETAGGADVAVEIGIQGAAPLTPEALAAAAPEVIVLPEAGLTALGGVEAFAAIPGVAETPAGQEGNYLVYEEAYFFNLGPRAGQALDQFVSDLHPELGG